MVPVSSVRHILSRLVLVACVVGFSGCQAPMQSGFECAVEPGYLSAQGVVAWRSSNAVDLIDGTGYVSPLAVREIENAVANEFAQKGYEFVDALSEEEAQTGTSLEIALTLRTRRELVSVEHSSSDCSGSECWERVDYNAQTRMDVRTIGFLAADIYQQGVPVWRGWVETTLYPKDRDESSVVIRRAIPRLFEHFPP